MAALGNCRKKSAYKTMEEAKIAAGIFAEKKNIVTYMRAYQCQCGKFHIGKTRNIDWDRVK